MELFRCRLVNDDDLFFFDGWLVKTVTLACSLLFTTLGIANSQLGIANRTRLLWTAVCTISFLRLLTQQLLLVSGRNPIRPEWLGVACLDLVGNVAAVDLSHLLMTNSLLWKDPPFLRTVNHL
jgi:hypothetical protein